MQNVKADGAPRLKSNACCPTPLLRQRYRGCRCGIAKTHRWQKSFSVCGTKSSFRGLWSRTSIKAQHIEAHKNEDAEASLPVVEETLVFKQTLGQSPKIPARRPALFRPGAGRIRPAAAERPD